MSNPSLIRLEFHSEKELRDWFDTEAPAIFNYFSFHMKIDDEGVRYFLEYIPGMVQ